MQSIRPAELEASRRLQPVAGGHPPPEQQRLLQRRIEIELRDVLKRRSARCRRDPGTNVEGSGGPRLEGNLDEERALALFQRGGGLRGRGTPADFDRSVRAGAEFLDRPLKLPRDPDRRDRPGRRLAERRGVNDEALLRPNRGGRRAGAMLLSFD